MKLTDVAVRRKSDGLYLIGHRPVKFSPTAKFLPSITKAKLIVRVDLGEDLSDFEFITRAALQEARSKE